MMPLTAIPNNGWTDEQLSVDRVGSTSYHGTRLASLYFTPDLTDFNNRAYRDSAISDRTFDSTNSDTWIENAQSSRKSGGVCASREYSRRKIRERTFATSIQREENIHQLETVGDSPINHRENSDALKCGHEITKEAPGMNFDDKVDRRTVCYPFFETYVLSNTLKYGLILTYRTNRTTHALSLFSDR